MNTIATTGTDIKTIAREQGAAAVGISGVDRLTEKPSMDAEYLLPGARSVISLMLPLDDAIVENYLAKKDRETFHRHETEIYQSLYRIGKKIAHYLTEQGHAAVVPEPNLDYRYKDHRDHKKISFKVKQTVADWMAIDSIFPVNLIKRALVPRIYKTGFGKLKWDLTPSFSHRYGAIAAGTGYPGWSGNVLHPDYGARVLYLTVLTSCELPSDPMIKKDPCDGCRLCVKVCQSGFIATKEEDSVSIGGTTYTHNKKAHNLRCIFVCGGFSGQNKYTNWSTWSPGRVPLPDTDEGLEDALKNMVTANLGKKNHYSGTLANLSYHSELGYIRKTEERFAPHCGFCQLVCSKERKEREKNYDIIQQAAIIS
ncbi:MAG: hypothetical protein GY754_17315 [bacterium]|nr:hypothetical protein [bacterium]